MDGVTYSLNDYLCIKTCRRVQLLLSSFFLLIFLLAPLLPARGRPLLKLSETVQKEGGGEEEMVMGKMIGSRPPRCQGICRACGRCEAVQVPAIPQQRSVGGKLFAALNNRDDDRSNYKPLSWKCKCGNLILNP